MGATLRWVTLPGIDESMVRHLAEACRSGKTGRKLLCFELTARVELPRCRVLPSGRGPEQREIHDIESPSTVVQCPHGARARASPGFPPRLPCPANASSRLCRVFLSGRCVDAMTGEWVEPRSCGIADRGRMLSSEARQGAARAQGARVGRRQRRGRNQRRGVRAVGHVQLEVTASATAGWYGWRQRGVAEQEAECD